MTRRSSPGIGRCVMTFVVGVGLVACTSGSEEALPTTTMDRPSLTLVAPTSVPADRLVVATLETECEDPAGDVIPSVDLIEADFPGWRTADPVEFAEGGYPEDLNGHYAAEYPGIDLVSAAVRPDGGSLRFDYELAGDPTAAAADESLIVEVLLMDVDGPLTTLEIQWASGVGWLSVDDADWVESDVVLDGSRISFSVPLGLVPGLETGGPMFRIRSQLWQEETESGSVEDMCPTEPPFG